MAKNTNRPVNKANQPAARQPVAAKQALKPGEKVAAPASEKNFLQRYFNIIVPAAIAIITWLFFKVCLDNQLTNWDDPGYIKDNPLIKDISPEFS